MEVSPATVWFFRVEAMLSPLMSLLTMSTFSSSSTRLFRSRTASLTPSPDRASSYRNSAKRVEVAVPSTSADMMVTDAPFRSVTDSSSGGRSGSVSAVSAMASVSAAASVSTADSLLQPVNRGTITDAASSAQRIFFRSVFIGFPPDSFRLYGDQRPSSFAALSRQIFR